MRKITSSCLFVGFVLAFLSCSNGQSKEVQTNVPSVNSASQGVNPKDSIYGFVRIDIDGIMRFDREITILNSDKTNYAKINGKKLLINDRKYDLLESRIDTLRKYMDSKSFDPEYSLFIARCIGKQNNYYQVIINGATKLVSSDSDLTKFETLEMFVLSSLPNLTETTPLRLEPNDTSSVIEGYESYFFVSKKIDGDWLLVECDQDYGGCPNKELKGWVKWKNGDEMLISLSQNY